MSPTLRNGSLSARWTATQVRTLWIIYWIGLFGLMHIPREKLPDVSVSNLDKAVHLTCYMLLALLCGATALRSAAPMKPTWYARWFLIFAAYAAADEITQPLVHRTCSVSDWLIDVLGIVVALTIIRLDARRRHPAR